MKWHRPASTYTTMDAWEKLREVVENGGATTMERMSGISMESIRWMAQNKPFMPYSEDFCKLIRETHRTQQQRKMRKFVSTAKLADRLKNLHWYGYSYGEMALGHSFSGDMLRRIASGEMPFVDKTTHGAVTKVIRIYESEQRRDLRNTIMAGKPMKLK